jgi:cell division protein FtsB
MKLFESKRTFGLSIIQLSILGVLVIILFVFSDSSIFKWANNQTTIRTLNTQIENYRLQTETNSRKLQELRSNAQDLEKFARENFLMKRDNEDLFIIVD